MLQVRIRALLLASVLFWAVPPCLGRPRLDQPWNLGAGHTLVPRAAFTDGLGITHTRMRHLYHGLQVWGSEVVVHSRGRGRIVGITPSAALPMKDATTPLAEPLPLDLEPSLSLAQAEQAILQAPGGAAAGAFSSMERVVFPTYTDHVRLSAGAAGPINDVRYHRLLAGWRLAYSIQCRAGEYLVDAHTGKILEHHKDVKYLTPEKGVGHSLLHGQQVDLDTALDGAQYVMIDTTRGHGGVFGGNAVTDFGHQVDEEVGGGPGTVYRNDRNEWGDGRLDTLDGDTRSATGQTVAVDAAYSLAATWDYYKHVHGRDGIDGKGTATYVRTHYRDQNFIADQGSWVGACFCISIFDVGDMYPVADLPTMGHELTHGVTESTANFQREGEPAALDEGNSDFFGVMVEAYTLQGGQGPTIQDSHANWTVGFKKADPEGGPPITQVVRWLYKPSKDASSPDWWTRDLESMDPHEGCGPLTRALYFMCDGASSDSASDTFSPLLPEGMAGIGNDKTAKIWYRALTTYLTPESDYKAARAAALRAAEDLFPDSAREADAVRKAFAAINVGGKEASADELGIPAITTAVAVHKNLLDLRVRPGNFKVNRFHQVNEVDYFVDDILLATSFTPPLFRVTLDTTRLLANGDHVMTARAFSPEANEGASLPRRFHLGNRTQQVLRDPGLEGSDAWQGDTGPVLTTDESGTDPHGGYRYARFAPAAEPRKLALHQRVAIPPAGQVEFSLWVRTRPGAAKDAPGALTLTVRDAGAPGAPAVLETLRRFTGSDPADWTRSSFDLGAYAGRTVELWLEADFAGGDGAAFWVDDLALVCSDQAPAKAGT